MAGLIVLDASVLIAHFNPLDAHHERATNILLDASAGSMLLHPLTVAEVLVGGARAGRAAQMRADIFAAGIVLSAVDEDEPLRLAELRAETGLKLPDCCVLEVAIRMQASLATFDDRLTAAATRRRVPVVARES